MQDIQVLEELDRPASAREIATRERPARELRAVRRQLRALRRAG